MTTILGMAEARDRFGADLEAAVRASVAFDGLLYEAARYHLETGGKRIRALIPVWLCHNLGGNAADAVPLAVGLELLHNGTLVHDDLQDGDRVRRGQPAIWMRWGAPQAINVGSALYFLSMREISRALCGPAIGIAATTAMIDIVDGQAREFQLQLNEGQPDHLAPTVENWRHMARGKTGALFGLCMRAGTLAAGLDDDADSNAAWGEALGVWFQVQDDFLDLVGDKGRDTKASDIAEGKISFPVALALDELPAGAGAELLAVVRKPRDETSAEDVAHALSLLEGSGALAQTAEWLRSHYAALESHAAAGLLPGLLERILAPVAHAL